MGFCTVASQQQGYGFESWSKRAFISRLRNSDQMFYKPGGAVVAWLAFLWVGVARHMTTGPSLGMSSGEDGWIHFGTSALSETSWI